MVWATMSLYASWTYAVWISIALSKVLAPMSFSNVAAPCSNDFLAYSDSLGAGGGNAESLDGRVEAVLAEFLNGFDLLVQGGSPVGKRDASVHGLAA